MTLTKNGHFGRVGKYRCNFRTFFFNSSRVALKLLVYLALLRTVAENVVTDTHTDQVQYMAAASGPAGPVLQFSR